MPRSDFYVPIFDSLPGHAKEVALREAMGWNGFESVGFLVWCLRQVAADFPIGELPGLEALKAMLRKVWKAADIKPRNDIVQLVAETLLEVGWIDWTEYDDLLEWHDWEDGAGMFEVKRQQEREKKRLQRAAARQKRLGSVPGTAESCPDGEGGETKKETEETPPNPPQAGGEFKFFENFVWETWEATLAEIGRPCAMDSKDILGASKIAKILQAGKVEPGLIAPAFRDFLKGVAADPKKKSWNLNTLSNNLTPYLPKEQPAPSRPPAPPEETVCWRFVCDVCGNVIFTDVPASHGTPEPSECLHGYRPSVGRKCTGMRRPVEIVTRPDASE